MLVTNGGKHAVYNAFTALLDPGDEVLLPAPYWTTYPEPIALAGARAGRCSPPTRRRASGSRVDQLEAARTRTRRRWCSSRRPTRRAPSTRPHEVEAIGRWAVEHGIWVITDEIYEHLTFGEHRFYVDAGTGARAGRHVHRAQRRGQDLRHDGLAGRVDDRPARRRRGGHQPAVALHVERRQRRPAGRARRGDRPARRRSPRCGRRSSAGRRWPTSCSTASRACSCIEPQGAFYAFPNLDRPPRSAASRAHGRRRPSSWPR